MPPSGPLDSRTSTPWSESRLGRVTRFDTALVGSFGFSGEGITQEQTYKGQVVELPGQRVSSTGTLDRIGPNYIVLNWMRITASVSQFWQGQYETEGSPNAYAGVSVIIAKQDRVNVIYNQNSAGPVNLGLDGARRIFGLKLQAYLDKDLQNEDLARVLRTRIPNYSSEGFTQDLPNTLDTAARILSPSVINRVAPSSSAAGGWIMTDPAEETRRWILAPEDCLLVLAGMPSNIGDNKIAGANSSSMFLELGGYYAPDYEDLVPYINS